MTLCFIGRDKTKHKEGGAWLAVTKSGKIGILTNFRHTSDVDQSKADTSLSPRGHLLVHYLTENASPPAFLDQILNGTKKYSLLNLLVGNFSSQSGFRFFYGSNAFECSKHDYELQPGLFLNNNLLRFKYLSWVSSRKQYLQILARNVTFL